MRLLPVLLFLIASVAECLMLSRVLVPQYKMYGSEALLKCDYNLGRDRLYAVKWYKDNEEFFRYVPRFNPPIYTHSVDGVLVDKSGSNDKRVLLRSLTVRSTGSYRCEVSAEAPSFASYMGEGRMTVVYLPTEAPQITGLSARDEYEVGSVLDLNCTSAKSFPPAKLSWYINDSPVQVPWPVSISATMEETTTTSTTPPSPYGIHHGSSQRNHGGGGVVGGSQGATAVPSLLSSLLVSSLRLQLQLQAHHFGPHGTAKIRCVARISPLFWQDGDEKILGGQQGQGQQQQGNQQQHNNNQHGTRHGRKKQQQQQEYYSGEEREVEEEEDDRPEMEESHKTKYHHNSNSNAYHHQNTGNNNNNNNNKHSQTNRHLHHHGFREEEMGEEEEAEGEDYDDDEYYGLGLPAFQREALVLVRGGCSSLNLSRITHLEIIILPISLLGYYY